MALLSLWKDIYPGKKMDDNKGFYFFNFRNKSKNYLSKINLKNYEFKINK